MKTPEMREREAEAILASLPENPTAKERAAIPHMDMPAQDPGERIHNMDEVALGYTESS